MRFSYHTEQWLPYSPARVFAFFADPGNLPRLMPEWQMARIDWSLGLATPPRPLPADRLRYGPNAEGTGSRIALSFRPFPFSPLRVRWEAEITEFSWNHHFCDRQLRGPFADWKHCHYVRAACRDGVDGSIVSDDIEYELPFGLAGRLAHRIFLRRQIERAFAQRQLQLALILADPASEPQPAS